MNKQTNSALIIDGEVAPGFEPVRQLYEHNMRTLTEANTQLCVYVDGKMVVDLWGSAVGDDAFSPDSLAGVFSSSKSFESIALAWLLDRGLIGYDHRITEYWPEFGGAGKENTTVADLMRHEAGLAAFNVAIDPADLLAENIKQNSVGAIIENHPQRYRKGTGKRREYHAVTRGWIANEIFRRVDPEGRTIGEFIRQELANPLGAGVILGVREDELGRIAPLSVPSLFGNLMESLKPRGLGRRLEWNFFDFCRVVGEQFSTALDNSVGMNPPMIESLTLSNIEFYADPLITRGESPSVNVQCSARGLAIVSAMLANHGQWQGQQILSEKAWQAMHADPIRANMPFMSTFTQGGIAQFHQTTAESPRMERRMHEGREGFYGWFGAGGSIFQWHPEYNIGFGYVPTSLFLVDGMNERGKAYQAEVVKCVEAAMS